jgi:toxin ParE1/3/4
MKLRWTAPALRDLEALGDYIARDHPAAAAKTITQILEQVDMLAAHPHAGRAGRVSGTRELVISGTPFIVPYRVRGDDVELLAVLHGARQWPGNFN